MYRRRSRAEPPSLGRFGGPSKSTLRIAKIFGSHEDFDDLDGWALNVLRISSFRSVIGTAGVRMARLAEFDSELGACSAALGGGASSARVGPVISHLWP